MNEFRPEEVLRELGFNTKWGKTSPPQTLYWHSLNVYLCAKELSTLVSLPLNDRELKILLWSSLLHDSGKESDSWQDKGHGPHPLSDDETTRLTVIFEKYGDTFAEVASGTESNRKIQMKLTEDEVEVVIEFITEHHTSHTLSNADKERIGNLLRTADNLVSATVMDNGTIDIVAHLLQPDYIPLILTAEDHPISYKALALADDYAEDSGVRILLVNRLQSLYLLPAGKDVKTFKKEVMDKVTRLIGVETSGDSNSVINKICSPKPGNRIKDGDMERFLTVLHQDISGIHKRIQEEYSGLQKRLPRNNEEKKLDIEYKMWAGPLLLLYDATKMLNKKAETLLDSNIRMSDVKNATLSKKGEIAKNHAQALGKSISIDYALKVLEIIRDSTNPPQIGDTVKLDVFRWSDDDMDITSIARQSYEYYKDNLWNDRTHKRNVKKYCFSCKTREPTREAPKTFMKTNTWTSANVGKDKVWVCDLCYLAQKYFIPQEERGIFHADATPAYNHVRVDWKNVFWQGEDVSGQRASKKSSHEIVFSLSGETPNEAITECLGYTAEYKISASKEYPSIVDFLYMNGLNGTVGAGPSNPESHMFTGFGITINYNDWRDFGGAMRLLNGTVTSKGVFPAASIWRKLVNEEWGWGSLFAGRLRNEGIAKKLGTTQNMKILSNFIKIRCNRSDPKMIEEIRNIPLLERDRNKRFSSAERIIRQMERVTLTAAKHPDGYGKDEKEIKETIAGIGLKRLRAENIKASGRDWVVSDNDLVKLQDSLSWVADRLWSLRDSHSTRRDFVNALIVAVAYSQNLSGEEAVMS